MRSRQTLVFLLFVCWTPFVGSAQEATPPGDDEMTFETTELRSAQEYTQIVATSERMVTDGDHFEALLKLIDILETGDDQEPYYSNAQFLVGVVLFHLELYQASYMYFERVLDAETPSERYNDVLPWLVAVHQRIPGEESTLERMAEYDEAVYPEQLKNEIHFFVGQFHYNQGTFRSALEALGKVTEGQEEFYLRARYLEGVVHVRNDNARASADSFKAILRYKVNSGLSSPVSEKIHRMALLTLARIFYTIGQYRTAIRYYDQIPDYSAHWLESLLEVSWSYFHVQNYGRALGNLHTLNSPYFEEEYFPEALVLEAVILYYNCHYDQSLASIHRFIRSYHPLFKELDEQLQVPRDPTQFYGWLARVSRSGSDISMRLKRIFNAALTDRKLNRRFRFVLHLNQELESLTRLSQNAPMTAFAAQLHGEISAVRALSVGEAGTLAKSRLQAVHEELRRQLSDALKVKFEALNAQKRVIEQNASIVDAESREFDHDTLDEEHQYWPFEGEYWKDELDSYTVGIESRCPTQAPAPNDASE